MITEGEKRREQREERGRGDIKRKMLKEAAGRQSRTCQAVAAASGAQKRQRCHRLPLGQCQNLVLWLRQGVGEVRELGGGGGKDT